MPTGNPAGVVYGVITIGALMAAESAQHETYAEALGSALVATALYWLAHAYADVLGRRVATGKPLSTGSLAEALIHDLAIVRGATIPLLALAIAWLVGASVEAGLTAAVRTAVVTIVVFEIVAGVRAKSTRSELLLQGAFGLTMGLGILALKSIVH